jgi:hypothetical protein
MQKVPMGFTSQSFIPDFKAEILTDFLASMRFINCFSRFPKRKFKKPRLTLRSLTP